MSTPRSPLSSACPRGVLLVAVLALLGPLAAACGAEGTGDKGYVAAEGILTQVDVGERRDLADLRGETLDGERVDVADYRGKVVVLNVWASWCAPCRAEAPALADAATTLGAAEDGQGEDVVFLGINTRDASQDNARAFERRYKVGYPSIYDPSGESLLAFRGTVGPNAIPSTIVVDPQGRIAASVLGELPSARTLVELVHDATGRSTP